MSTEKSNDTAFTELLNEVGKAAPSGDFKAETAENVMDSLFNGNLTTLMADLDVAAQIERDAQRDI